MIFGTLAAHAQLPIEPVGDSPTAAAEGQELTQLFTLTRVAASRIVPGPDAAFQRRQMADELDNELESFVTNHSTSVWTPSVHLWLARKSQLRLSYSAAMDHFAQAWTQIRDSQVPAVQHLRIEASGGLAKLLALTGRLAELNELEAQAGINEAEGSSFRDWGWALEMRAWVQKHPDEAYKCGLHCLDQLGRLTQLGEFKPKAIVETASTTNGFSAAELVAVATRAGLRVHAARLLDANYLPVPSIIHLRSEHFVVLREQRGDFYNVYDTAAFGPKWITASEIAREATGCVIVSDAQAVQDALKFTAPMDLTSAAAFRGRCHGPMPWDHDDSPCPTDSPANSNTGGSSPDASTSKIAAGDSPHNYSHGDGGCQSCAGDSGMPTWSVSEPFLNLWVQDRPLYYQSAYGPAISLRLAYNERAVGSVVSYMYWQGAQFGNAAGSVGLWSCSWMSFAELSDDENTVDLMLPGGRWATFTFPAGSSISDVQYRHNFWLERVGSAGNFTSLILHHPDGSGITYALRDDSYDPSFRVYYMSDAFNPSGEKTAFTYDTHYSYCFALTNVTAADGTAFTLHLDSSQNPPFVTSITTSYGVSVSFDYYLSSQYNAPTLTNITDAAGISSQIEYEGMPYYAGAITKLITPYGTTLFSTSGDNFYQGIFDRTVRITNAAGQQEFYASMNTYLGSDWPDFDVSQIPTNTPLGTLDTSERQERNTFYWNAQQFALYTSTGLDAFSWPAFNGARIRHWLASIDPSYTHWNTLSLQQEPSPSGSTNTQGQLTWFDYAGKDTNATYEIGKQIMPAVVARVMPDGSTAYQYFERLTNGLPTKAVEKWSVAGNALYRTNTYSYAANNIDLTLHIGPYGEQVASNVFNGYHQVTTNYDALNQKTTYTYDATTRQLTSVTQPTGLVTTNYYDGNHRLQQTTDLPINATESYTWGADGNVKSVTDARGLVVTNYWDGLNRLTGRKYPDGTTTTNLYSIGTAYPDSSGGLNILDVTATKDRLGYWTYYGYDALRRLTAVTNANQVVTRYGYCDCGGTSSLTNAWGTAVQHVTSYDYDYQGHRIFTYYPDATVTNWFDALGRSVTTCDAWGCRWFGYDNLNRLTSITNAFGAERITTYDLEDRPIYVTDANNVTLTNTYDDLGRLRTRTAPDGGVEAFGYSARGLIAYTNQIGHTNFYAYDEARRKTCETNANWEVIRYTNSPAGDLLALVDGKNQVTKWNYDEYGRVTNKVDQVGAAILRYTYDADSRLVSRWSKQKGTTYYTNDAVGNLTKVNYPTSPDVTLAYDPLNRVTNMVDAAGTTKYTYTVGGQLYTEDGPFASDTVTNTWNNRLRVGVDLQQPTGVWTNRFAYDAAKRLTSVTSPAGAFSYTFVGQASRLTQKLSLPNSSYITNTYDSVARLLTTKLLTSSSALLNSHSYSYNPAHQRTQQVFNAGSTVNYTYDAIGQLKVADSATASEDRGYNYDTAWNLHYRTNNTTLNTFTVDGKNQLTTAFGGNCGYDSNGNLTNYNSGAVVYSYDDENQLTWAEDVDKHKWATTFVYDGLGRLRKRVEYAWSGVWTVYTTTWYLYDGRRVIQERNASNVPQVSYTRGTDLSGTLEGAGGIGGLLGRSHGYSAGNWSTHNYYHADGNGNVTYLVNNSQTLAASYRYDPYGNLISQSGTLASANVYRFSSKELHVNSGLYYYGFRFYDPNTQRWLNRDPLEEWGGINLYVISANAPTTDVDIDGLTIYPNPPIPDEPPASPPPAPKPNPKPPVPNPNPPHPPVVLQPPKPKLPPIFPPYHLPKPFPPNCSISPWFPPIPPGKHGIGLGIQIGVKF